jgi:arylsulfatase A-like enzyme
MKPIRVLFSLLCAVTAMSAAAQTPHALPRRPCIILIIANGLGAGDLSCYGQTRFQTPSLDKLASEGVRFTHYSAGSADNSNAREALMLGKNISTDVTLGRDDLTIAQLLKNSGYHTAYVGEWDFGDQNSTSAPWLEGFDEFAGYFNEADAENPYGSFIWRYAPDPAGGEKPHFNGAEGVYANSDGKRVQFIPDWFGTLAMNFTKNHVPRDFNDYQPFFLVINWPVPGNGNRVVPTDAPYSEESWPQAEKNRAAIITRLDDSIGKLMEHLDKYGLSTNTVIFFTSDTVPKKMDGTDPKFFKENAAPDSLRVPLIVRWPARIPAGQVCDVECSARDFLPTAAAMGIVQPREKVDGVSLIPELLGQPAK